MRVTMVDLLATTPFYDRYLCEALFPLVECLALYAITFRHIPSYWDNLGCARSPGLLDIASRLNLRQEPLRRGAKLIEYVLNWNSLLAKLPKSSLDIVHVQWFSLLSRSDMELGFARRIKRHRISLVYTMHNLLPHDNCDDAVVRERHQQLYDLADALVVHTAQDKRDLVNQFGIQPAKVFEVKQGAVQHEQAAVLPDRLAIRQQLGWDDSWFVYLIMGVIRPYKGIEEALQALAQVVGRVPEARLYVAGQGSSSYISTLRRMAVELGVDHQVIWDLDFVSLERVPLLHGASQVTMFPYRNISQSEAMLTAVGLGAFVLAAQLGGLEEVIRDGKTGMGWHTKDPVDLAQRMIDCVELGQARRDQLAAAAQHLVLTEYSWDKIAQDTLHVYEWALSQR